jgi:hypothetical protein
MTGLFHVFSLTFLFHGRGFKKSNLYLFIAFCQDHPDFFQSATEKFPEITDDEIFQSVTGKSEGPDIYSILKPLRPNFF